MKAFKIILILLILTSCRSTKQATKSNIDTSKKTEVNQSKETDIETNVNTSESAKLEKDVSIKKTTKIVTDKFAPPTPDEIAKAKAENKPAKGALESTTTTTTIEEQVDKSKATAEKNIQAEDNSKIKENNSAKTDDKSNIETKETEKKSVPIRWGWIFGILFLSAAGLIYWKRSKVFTWLKSVLSKVAGKLKI